VTAFLEFVLVLLIFLLAAKLASWASIKLGQPSVFGVLLMGILLGPSLLDVIHLPFFSSTHLEELFLQLGELGVLLLMFLAGLELNLKDLAGNTRVSALAGALGVFVPVSMGWLAGELHGLDFIQSLFLGLILGATSVSISAQTLMELKALRTRVGLGLLGAAVFDDILVILLLSITLAAASGAGSLLGIALVFARMLLYLAASVAVGIYLLPWLTRKAGKLPVSQSVLTLALTVMLFYGLMAELVGGMAAITGTFIAGLMFSRTDEKEHIEAGMRSLAYAFFVPLFFISIGLSINLREISGNALTLMLIMSVLGILGKIIGSGLGAKLGGFSTLESLQLGAGMVSRGEVGLIVATIGLNNGFVDPEEVSAAIGMVLITTLVTPPLLRWLFKKKQASGQAAADKKQSADE
jgi:Kef-type K+ transport system membrane component KefB